MSVILETSIGDIVVDLYTQERPRCCLNFLKLCKLKYYNFCLFHSVQRGLVAQTGDPLGTGKGGESVYRFLYGDQAAYFDMEIKPRIKHTKLGQLSMVNNGVNLHGSQFFITLAPNIDYLDGKHTVFGEVVEGFEVLQKFNEAYVDQESRPYKDIRIYHSIIVDDPFDDPPGLEKHIPDGSPQLTREQLDSVRIGAEEDIDDMQGLKPAEIEEMTKERESKAHAQILEMIGDLPAADVAPPDNVLFVCKLNPVTTEDDLEIIFSRFGKIIGCEVIKDQKTGNSLQYAFIEFEKPSDCENAYFKMDNVLIDDRRIHVDFSQSVAKLKWKGKGKGVEHVQEKDEGPRFRIKNPDDRRDNNYDFVFDDDNNEKTTASDEPRTKKPKKHKKQRSRSNSDDEKSPQHKHRLKEKSHRSKIRGSSSDGEDRKPHKKHKSTIEHKVKEAHGKHLDERRRPRSPSAEDHHRIRKNRSMSRTPPPRYSKSQSDCHEHHHRKDDRDRHGDSKHRATDADRRHRNEDSNTSSYRHGESSRSRRH